MNQMQCAGKAQKSTINNIIIMRTIIEKKNLKASYISFFFGDAVKFCNKLCSRDCLIEFKTLGYKYEKYSNKGQRMDR